MIAIPLVILIAIPAIAKVLFRGRPLGHSSEVYAGCLAFLVGCLLTAPATWLSGMPISEAFGGNIMLGILGTGVAIWFAGDEMVLLARRVQQLPIAYLRTALPVAITVGWPLVTPPVLSYALGLSH